MIKQSHSRVHTQKDKCSNLKRCSNAVYKANTWKHKCPLTDNWLKKMSYMCVCVCVYKIPTNHFLDGQLVQIFNSRMSQNV